MLSFRTTTILLELSQSTLNAYWQLAQSGYSKLILKVSPVHAELAGQIPSQVRRVTLSRVNTMKCSSNCKNIAFKHKANFSDQTPHGIKPGYSKCILVLALQSLLITTMTDSFPRMKWVTLLGESANKYSPNCTNIAFKHKAHFHSNPTLGT